MLRAPVTCHVEAGDSPFIVILRLLCKTDYGPSQSHNYQYGKNGGRYGGKGGHARSVNENEPQYSAPSSLRTVEPKAKSKAAIETKPKLEGARFFKVSGNEIFQSLK